MAEPIRRGMEMKICAEGDALPGQAMSRGGEVSAGVRGPSVGMEILEGRDTEIGWGDVFRMGEEAGMGRGPVEG